MTVTRTVSQPGSLPDGHVGLAALPGTNREVWWTGRVAIGLLCEPLPQRVVSADAERIQTALLSKRRTLSEHLSHLMARFRRGLTPP